MTREIASPRSQWGARYPLTGSACVRPENPHCLAFRLAFDALQLVPVALVHDECHLDLAEHLPVALADDVEGGSWLQVKVPFDLAARRVLCPVVIVRIEHIECAAQRRVGIAVDLAGDTDPLLAPLQNRQMVTLEPAGVPGDLVLAQVHREEVHAEADFVGESEMCWHWRNSWSRVVV